MKKGAGIIVLFALIVLSVSFSSAFSWESLFGKEVSLSPAVADNTAFANTPDCTDSDGGVYSAAGGITKVGSAAFAQYDVCSGSSAKFYDAQGNRIPNIKTKIKEYYCASDGKLKSIEYSAKELGEGYCMQVNTNFTDANGGVESYAFMARWVTKGPSCKFVSNGVFKNQDGDLFRTGCYKNDTLTSGGDDRITYNSAYLTFKNFSCGANGLVVEAPPINCAALGAKGCSMNAGCIGICSDTDSEDSVVTAGQVNAGGAVYGDACVGTNQIKQFSCGEKGNAAQKVTSCGMNSRCTTNANGLAYCTSLATTDEIGAVNATANSQITALNTQISSLSAQIANLQSLIENLTTRIEALEENTVVA